MKVYGIDNLKYEIGHFSRWIKYDKRISYLPAGQRLVEGLLALGAEQQLKPVLFVACDPYIDFIAQNREKLEKYFILTDSMCRAVNSMLLNKKTFYERCQKLEVSLPITFFPETKEQALQAAKQLRYPAIVKPTISHLMRRRLKGEKLVEVSDAENLLLWWQQFRKWDSDSVLQETVEGPESNIYVAGVYSDRNLNCRSLFTAHKVRQYPPNYGSGSYMEAEWSQEICDLTIDLINKLEYRGICATEFKLDRRDNQWKLIEVNCRPALWFALASAAGVDVVWDAYCDLTGHPNPININCQNDNIRWQLLVRDIISGLHFLRSGEICWKEFFHTVVSPRSKEYAILSSKDLGTVLAYPIDTIIKFFTHFVIRK